MGLDKKKKCVGSKWQTEIQADRALNYSEQRRSQGGLFLVRGEGEKRTLGEAVGIQKEEGNGGFASAPVGES